MTSTTPRVPQETPRPTREDIQREEQQEAVWNSFEHGAPETGPAEDLDIADIDIDDGTRKSPDGR